MMTEQEERDQINKLIAEDVKYLKENENPLQRDAILYFNATQESSSLKEALAKIKTFDSTILDQISILELKHFYHDNINPLVHASRAFFSNHSDDNTKNKLIEAAKGFNEYTNSISIKDVPQSTNFQLKHDGGAGLSQEFDKIYLRINNLENKPDEIIQALNDNLKHTEKLASSANKLSQKSEQTLDDILKFKQETIEQNEELVTKLENTINQKISTLLSKQLEEKSTKLFREVIIKFILFFFSLIILFLFNVSLMEIYLNVTGLPFVPKIYPALSKMDFWHFIALKLSMNIPFFLFIGFTLNDYTKTKKLYEEYEFRKISAITLFTNYERLTKELGMEKEDLMESLKSSLDKIFDNPVHSIYGDKSGDKNIGLDQLEKIASILTKLKPNNP